MIRELTRDEWCRTRTRGRLSAAFEAGEVMRCPLSRTLSSGRWQPCGGDLGRAPHGVEKAVVRGPVDLPPIANADHTPRTCSSCRKTLDVYFVPPAQYLAKTG